MQWVERIIWINIIYNLLRTINAGRVWMMMIVIIEIIITINNEIIAIMMIIYTVV